MIGSASHLVQCHVTAVYHLFVICGVPSLDLITETSGVCQWRVFLVDICDNEKTNLEDINQ